MKKNHTLKPSAALPSQLLFLPFSFLKKNTPFYYWITTFYFSDYDPLPIPIPATLAPSGLSVPAGAGPGPAPISPSPPLPPSTPRAPQPCTTVPCSLPVAAPIATAVTCTGSGCRLCFGGCLHLPSPPSFPPHTFLPPERAPSPRRGSDAAACGGGQQVPYQAGTRGVPDEKSLPLQPEVALT